MKKAVRVTIFAVIIQLMFGVVLAGGDGAGGAPKQAADAPTWGPYTSEGMALSERTPERFGWLIGDFNLYPYAEAVLVYEDNIFLNSADEQDETYSIFTPGAMLVYGSPRGNYLYLDYRADFTSLQEFGNSAFDGQALKAGAHFANARIQADASHEYREVRDVDVQVGTRLKRKSNATTLSCDNRISSKTSVGIEGRHLLNRFDDRGYSDYNEYSVAGRAAWQMLPRASLTGRAGHGWVDVDETRDAYGSAQYDEVTIGLAGKPRPRLETSMDVGVQHRYFEDDQIDDITREVGRVRVAANPLERIRVWLTGSASMNPAINADGYTVLDTRGEAGVSRRLFVERLVGGVSVFRGRNEYLGSGGGEMDDRVYNGRQDDYWGLKANVDWWIGRYWLIGLGYSYTENDSEADEELQMGRGIDPSSYEAGRWTLRASFNR